MTKITIKIGNTEIDFDGSEEFIRNDLADVLASISEVVGHVPENVQPEMAAKAATKGGAPDYSVKTICSKLGMSKGSDLARASAAFLTLVAGKETFTKAELLAAMKSATGIYKQSTHGKNIGSIVSSLVSENVLFETSSGMFALAQDQRDSIEKSLNG